MCEGGMTQVTKYDPKTIEAGKYEYWQAHDCFRADGTGKSYTIILPPPNITGKLHLGHAWDATLQDILIRYHKMKGYNTVWIPGLDHAGK